MIDPTVVVPPAEIDVETAGALDEILARCDPQQTTVLDFSDVTFCDSSGLSVLVQHALRHLEAGGKLRITAAPAIVRRLVEITDLGDLLDVEDAPSPPHEQAARAARSDSNPRPADP